MLLGVVAAGSALLGALAGVEIGRRRRSRSGHRDPSMTPVPMVEDESTVLAREAVTQLDIGIVVTAATGEIAFSNTMVSQMSGTQAGLVLDDHLGTLLLAARGGKTGHRLIELHGPPKSWLAIRADPLPSGGAVATVQDVSEQMQSDMMRTDFVANISHELKTPVGGIAALAETLVDEPDPEVVSRLARHLVEESHRAARTIDDLLTLSRIESARAGDAIVDLSAVVQAAVGRGRVADGGRGVKVAAVDESPPVFVSGDEYQLVSALGNLVENAVKYSSEGDLVEVRTQVSNDAVEVAVTDEGDGIPAADIARVFERFYRVDKARSRETGGTGLGLAIVRHVANNHGGEVLVTSVEGEGSTFTFRIPMDRVATEDELVVADHGGVS